MGAMRYLSVDRRDRRSRPRQHRRRVRIELHRAANRAPEQSFYACEQWTLSRQPGASSRTPDRARGLHLPVVRRAARFDGGRPLPYCQATVDTGQFDWVVDAIQIASREARGPILTGTTEEKGTDLPTIVDPDAHGPLRRAYPARSAVRLAAGFRRRVAMIFGAMQASWATAIGPRCGRSSATTCFRCWLIGSKPTAGERLRNITEGARVEQIELARVTSDKFFDALTVRLFATSLDYTVTDGDGRVVGGNRHKPRRYSEYWTLIRGAGKKGPVAGRRKCPSCGAPLRIEMAGTCTYCRAKVTSGEFDWVLSRIEQDDVYDG